MSEKLFYSPQAQLDLEEIYDYFAGELGDSGKGRRVVSDVLAAAEGIPARAKRYPLVGPLPFTNDVYRFMPVKDYLLFFRVVDDTVYVDRILYKRRDFSSLLGLPHS